MTDKSLDGLAPARGVLLSWLVAALRPAGPWRLKNSGSVRMKSRGTISLWRVRSSSRPIETELDKSSIVALAPALPV